MGKTFAIGSAAVIVLILVKDGTLGELAKNAATFVATGAKGIKPITGIA